MSTKERYSQD
ncbi:Protein of unknown function [Lactobacillus acidophilus CIRM-BIA 445]|nr:Protein of unknown function [Lactobacillus acidophilus CIRM-BIA 445]CDF74501.1 Protein of unknown function [Lactobacillus acidophilus DSM 20242]